MNKQTALTMPSIRIKRKIVRSVIADAVIESTRFYEGVLVFCLDNGTELHVEIPHATFRKLRDHMTAELNRVLPHFSSDGATRPRPGCGRYLSRTPIL
jgi:hypothetical protein